MIRIIQDMSGLTAKILGRLTNENCTSFQPSPYIIARKTEGGLLIFATLTCALMYIEGADSLDEMCRAAIADAEMRKILLSRRVLIPEDSDEQKLCEQLRSLMLNEKKRQLHGRLQQFIIFTTTACNARCYYCFEHGYGPCAMSSETAQKTAEYIAFRAEGEVTLTWFGGEPLVNTGAIDLITGYLSAHGVPFKSHIVTNSYLFTPELIRKAVSEWHLIRAQITLDGTRENYNRIKNYTGNDPDAYGRVTGNIDRLAESGVNVLINLLLSKENESDMYALLREFLPRVTARRERFAVCVNILQQYGGTPEEDEMQLKLIRMKKWMRENGYDFNTTLPENLMINSCTADHPGMVCIQADGGLNKCDHISECPPFGSIFNDETDLSRVDWWKERKEALPECDGCALYPLCLRLKHCAAKKTGCTAVTRNERLSEIKEAMARKTV